LKVAADIKFDPSIGACDSNHLKHFFQRAPLMKRITVQPHSVFFLLLLTSLVLGCGSGGSDGSDDTGETQQTSQTEWVAFADDWPEAGTADALCTIPDPAQLVDTSSPDQVVGDGTPEGCTS
jgi:hypothetical protein